MSPNLTLVVVSSALIGTGVYLFLSRSLVRALMGFLLMGNGINLLFVIGSGPAGAPPIVGESDAPMADPVPQALVLTAIVITFGATAFLLALAYRAWLLSADDEVVDDVEDRTVAAGGIIDREVTDEEEQARDVEKDTDAEAEEQQPA